MRSPSSTPLIWHRLEALDDKGFTVRCCRYYRVRAFPRYLLISTARTLPGLSREVQNLPSIFPFCVLLPQALPVRCS